MALVDRTVAEVLDLLAAREPAPGGGSAAALAGAMAAALSEMALSFALGSSAAGGADPAGGPDRAGGADRAGGPDRAGGADRAGGPDRAGGAAVLVELRDRARELRARLLTLADDDTRSYRPVLDALALPRADPSRPARLQAALATAAEVPLAIATAAAEVGDLAAAAAQAGNAHLLGDATAGVVLAEAAARSAARLVELNLTSSPQDARLIQARAIGERAGAAREAVLGADRSYSYGGTVVK
jgi:formiminotetrahydrofolate cyclodeaminase